MSSERALIHFGIPGMKWGKRKGPSELDDLKGKIHAQKQANKQASKTKKVEESTAKKKAALEKKLHDQTPEGKKKKQEEYVRKIERGVQAVAKTLDYMGSDEVAIYSKIRETDPELADRYVKEQRAHNPNYGKTR